MTFCPATLWSVPACGVPQLTEYPSLWSASGGGPGQALQQGEEQVLAEDVRSPVQKMDVPGKSLRSRHVFPEIFCVPATRIDYAVRSVADSFKEDLWGIARPLFFKFCIQLESVAN